MALSNILTNNYQIQCDNNLINSPHVFVVHGFVIDEIVGFAQDLHPCNDYETQHHHCNKFDGKAYGTPNTNCSATKH